MVRYDFNIFSILACISTSHTRLVLGLHNIRDIRFLSGRNLFFG